MNLFDKRPTFKQFRIVRLSRSLVIFGSELTASFRVLSTVVQENNVRLRLNIVDTPGYGDLVNNENWFVAMLNLLRIA